MLNRGIAAGTDCSEIACDLLNAAGGEWSVLRVEPGEPGLNLKVTQNGYEEQYLYHEVHSDGRFIFDPRLSPEPIPVSAWEQGIRAENPDASITSC